MQTEELVAGPALDAKVATEVMGWQSTHKPGGGCYRPPGDCLIDWHWTEVPPYSSDIGAAFQVVEHLIGKGYLFRLNASPLGVVAEFVYDDPWIAGEADTAPLAICKAALKAVSTT